jgi:hypothetical protein
MPGRAGGVPGFVVVSGVVAAPMVALVREYRPPASATQPVTVVDVGFWAGLLVLGWSGVLGLD